MEKLSGCEWAVVGVFLLLAALAIGGAGYLEGRSKTWGSVAPVGSTR